MTIFQERLDKQRERELNVDNMGNGDSEVPSTFKFTLSREESSRKIEKPVTRDILRSAAEAGYTTEVYLGINFANESVSVDESRELLNIARRAEAEKLQKEADIIQGLLDQSDDPQWQSLFGGKAIVLRTSAEVKRQEADEKEKLFPK